MPQARGDRTWPPAESVVTVGDDGVSGDLVLAEHEGEGYDQAAMLSYYDAVDEWLLVYQGSLAEYDASLTTAPASRISAGLPGRSAAESARRITSGARTASSP